MYIIAPATRLTNPEVCAAPTFGGTINIIFAATPVRVCPASAKSIADLGTFVPTPTVSKIVASPLTSKAIDPGTLSVLTPTLPPVLTENLESAALFIRNILSATVVPIPTPVADI